MATSTATPFSRPYRSHRVPACDNCRNRKVRCVLDVPGQSCRCCRERTLACNYVSMTRVSSNERDQMPAKRQKNAHWNLRKGIETSAVYSSQPFLAIPNMAAPSPAESTVMMNPPMAEDIAILEQYLIHKSEQEQMSSKPYSTISAAPDNPIIYLTVPRKRKGLNSSTDPGRSQKEIIEQILSPYAAEVRKLYFDYLHPCFPILDEDIFQGLWHRDSDRISSTLLCDIYASALSFWRRSSVLCQQPLPDANFIWNLAVTALQEDFSGPTISSLYAALLDMVGRPVGAVTGNIVNAGKVATLAQSLGLHRDPTSWKGTLHEKKVRIRLWWGVVIHDHWSSIGHGTPPLINSKYYDVPLVTLDMLVTSDTSESYTQSASTFVQLCKLTHILGSILPLVYELQMDVQDIWRSLRKAECALDDWLLSLPPYIASQSSLETLGVNGSSNLWFAYLSLQLLLCRLDFKATLKDGASTSTDRQYRLSRLRKASCRVITFIISLTDAQMQEFWLPYTSYLLVTAATILLRCVVECGDLPTKKSCIEDLVRFRDRLRRGSQNSGWDLADFCLERCDEPIQKFADALQSLPREIGAEEDGQIESVATHDGTPQHGPDYDARSDAFPLSDLLLTGDSFEHPWEEVWNSFEWPT
ncbi:fungal-specific transcription factor domain-containing protein [Phaeosphaeria sp. MPI-PUGE-AT-0046c]|nr:fungal-specific transcription factor domain-containing protein [Phaeosphaeria sp. MPI-PUGE-AT-0046c]